MLKECRKQLLTQLDSLLKPLGFRRSEQSFWRSFPGGQEAFHIAFIPHRSVDFDLTADVAVRYDDIEEKLNAQRANLSGQIKRQTATIGAELGNLKGAGQMRWTVSREADIPAVVAGVFAEFRETGEPFLLRFRSLDELRRVFIHDPVFAKLICLVPDKRAKLIALLDLQTTTD